MQRQTILLLFGGESSEHDVSISSARNVYAAIDDRKFDVLLGYIDRKGCWWLIDSLDGEVSTSSALQLVPSLGNREFKTVPEGQSVRPDVIFATLHGKNGEDGSVQGVAQLLHVPIVGCGVAASAICMDKMRAKMLVNDIVSTAKSVTFAYSENASSELMTLLKRRTDGGSDFTDRVGFGPWFVKPSRAGSSVGVSKVINESELESAIIAAFEYDSTVIVEEAIEGRELEVSVLGNPPYHRASGVGEIAVGDTFYSYEEKYASTSTAHIIIDADLSDSLRTEIAECARSIYERLGCQGLARVDFFLASDGGIYFNEVNTLPGFTNSSMYPKLWREEGVSYSELIERLITLAFEKDATLEV